GVLRKELLAHSRAKRAVRRAKHASLKRDDPGQTINAIYISGKPANVDVSFCDPQFRWQRRSNENTNWLLRQYLPRGTDLTVPSQAKLSAIARPLNERPRKTSQYQTSAERFAACVASIS
ncbi:transposase, partial [Yoonia sp.]|uniref:transposase n=1 Tax=Yoonia sp. TaxID=2212373 RepID=UPI002383B5B1|nr:hypothetical protein [Yoonia sp.]